MTPRRAGVIPKTAWSEETRMSQAIASSSPPPKAKPFSMAITGAGNDSTERIMSSKGLLESSTCASPDPPAGIAVMSYPAQNASSPSPRSTTHRASSPARSVKAFRSSPRIFRFSAFFLAGWETVTVATGPSLSTMTFPPILPSRSPGFPGHRIFIRKRRACCNSARVLKGLAQAGDQGEGKGRKHHRAETLREEGQGRSLPLLPEAAGGGPPLPQGQRHRPSRGGALGRGAELRQGVSPSRVEGERGRGRRHPAQEHGGMDEARRDDPGRDRPGFPAAGAGGHPGARALPARPEMRPREDRRGDDGDAAGREEGLRKARLPAGSGVPRACARPDRRAPRSPHPDQGPRGVLGEHPDPRVLLLPLAADGGINEKQRDKSKGTFINFREKVVRTYLSFFEKF